MANKAWSNEAFHFLYTAVDDSTRFRVEVPTPTASWFKQLERLKQALGLHRMTERQLHAVNEHFWNEGTKQYIFTMEDVPIFDIAPNIHLFKPNGEYLMFPEMTMLKEDGKKYAVTLTGIAISADLLL